MLSRECGVSSSCIGIKWTLDWLCFTLLWFQRVLLKLAFIWRHALWSTAGCVRHGIKHCMCTAASHAVIPVQFRTYYSGKTWPGLCQSSLCPLHSGSSDPWRAIGSEPWRALSSEPQRAISSEPWQAISSGPWRCITSEPWRAISSEPWRALSSESRRAPLQLLQQKYLLFGIGHVCYNVFWRTNRLWGTGGTQDSGTNFVRLWFLWHVQELVRMSQACLSSTMVSTCLVNLHMCYILIFVTYVRNFPSILAKQY